MRGINKCTILGRLGADPEMRYTPTGRAMTHFRVAVPHKWRDEAGQLQEKTEWFRVVAGERLAETAHQYLEKGAPVYVEGRLETRSYEAADGQTRYNTELVVTDLVLLPRGGAPVTVPGEEGSDE